MVANADHASHRHFGLDYCLRYKLHVPGLARWVGDPARRTSNHFRTPMLRELGGWDAWNVTEDADLGMRCRARLSGRCRRVGHLGETPHPRGLDQAPPAGKGFCSPHWCTPATPPGPGAPSAGPAPSPCSPSSGIPLLYLAQPIVLALWASGYKGLIATHLPAWAHRAGRPAGGLYRLDRAGRSRSPPPQARPGRVRPAAARLLGDALDRQLARPVPADPRPVPVGEDPHLATAAA